MAASQGKTAKPEPKRIRVNVPAADESVLEWFELQENHSLSVRQLIRESIERHGYIDVVNRPVAQLPKRGRPAGGEEGFQVTSAEEHLAKVAAETELIQARVDEARAERTPGDAAELDLSEPENGKPELLGIALQVPALAPTPVQQVPDDPTPADPAPSAGGQQEVNDIFASLRG